MLMSFTEFEREMIAERTRDKIAAARRKGKWTGGPQPLGYTVVDKRLVVNDLEAVVVREVFGLYLEHHSALTVARLLNERHRSTKRHRAANGNLRESRSWTKGDVLCLLKNPVYAGYMPSGGELQDAEHKALVPRETFARARALLEEATLAKKDRGRNPEYIHPSRAAPVRLLRVGLHPRIHPKGPEGVPLLPRNRSRPDLFLARGDRRADQILI
jgi:hypothetical protein